jgi:hypothetical protein
MFFLKKSKPTVKITTNDKFYVDNFEEVFVSAKKYLPTWYKNLCPVKNLSENISKNLFRINHTQGRGYELNVKTCPALIDLFTNSFIIRTPTEIAFQSLQNKFYWKYPLDTKLFGIDMHPESQVGDFYKFKEKQNIKFSIPLKITTEKKTRAIWMHPSYHVNNDNFFEMETVPGIVEFGKRPIILNVNTLIKITEKNFVLPAGHPIAMIYFFEKVKIELEYDPNATILDNNKFFSSAKDYRELNCI